jgi:hypothetical protein
LYAFGPCFAKGEILRGSELSATQQLQWKVNRHLGPKQSAGPYQIDGGGRVRIACASVEAEQSPLRSLASSGLLLIFRLMVIAILTAMTAGVVWLAIRAPQVLILGAILLLVCSFLLALLGSLGSRSQ